MINTFENFQKMYQEKLMTADEAVKSIKSGDTIAYGEFVTVPYALDAALARRVNELYDIDIDASTLRMESKTYEVDPNHEHFRINDRSLTPQSRRTNAFYLVGSYEENVKSILEYRNPDACFFVAAPMDKHGYFNLSTTYSNQLANAANCKNIIIEVNKMLRASTAVQWARSISLRFLQLLKAIMHCWKSCRRFRPTRQTQRSQSC